MLHFQQDYLQTFPKLVAALALTVPLAYAPLLFNLIAIAVQALPAAYLLSLRLATIWSFRTRLLLALVCVGLPNSQEIHANITNSQWHLALLGLLIILAPASERRSVQVLEALALALSCLTGPFVVILVLVALVLAFRRRAVRDLRLAVIAVATAIQIAAVLFGSGAGRVHEFRAATPAMFVEIVARRVVLPLFIGTSGVAHLRPHRFALMLAVVLLTVAAQAFALARARLETKLFILFADLTLAAALIDPMAPPPQWPVLSAAPGIRYWLFPMLGVVVALLWLAESARIQLLRWTAVGTIAAMSIGITRDWRDHPFDDTHFRRRAAAFQQLPPRTYASFPLNPAGWSMELRK